MKKILFSAAAVLGAALYGQVGINTTSPKATFEVQGQPTFATAPDGVIPPQLTRQQLIDKTNANTYSTNQKGAMVYVTDLSGTTTAATSKVDKVGFYYFDGFAWQKVGGDDWSLTGNNIASGQFLGTSNDQDLVLKRSNIEVARFKTDNAISLGGARIGGGSGGGYGAFGMGVSNEAKGNQSVAMGYSSSASGFQSIAIGAYTIAKNKAETALGSFNFLTDTIPSDNQFYVDNSQLFSIGNGNQSPSLRSNALIVLRNANTGIGLPTDVTTPANSKPTEMLDVNGNIRTRGAAATITDGSTTCSNLGTITFNPSDGNFYGCTGTAIPGIWKKLNN